MGMDISKFEMAKNKARKMIHEDAKRDSHIIKERTADRNNPKYFSDQPRDAYSSVQSISSDNRVNESIDDDSEERLYSAMDSNMNKFLESKNASNYSVQMQTSAPKVKNKNLPKEILESFSNNYISQDAFDPNRSVLATMGIEGDSLAEANQTGYVGQQQTVSSTAKIDYELIKNIVEGTVKKYINALGKKMLTESKTTDNGTIKAIQFTGDKFKIVTSKGDLYEAKMQFVKNVNDK